MTRHRPAPYTRAFLPLRDNKRLTDLSHDLSYSGIAPERFLFYVLQVNKEVHKVLATLLLCLLFRTFPWLQLAPGENCPRVSGDSWEQGRLGRIFPAQDLFSSERGLHLVAERTVQDFGSRERVRGARDGKSESPPHDNGRSNDANGTGHDPGAGTTGAGRD